MTWREAEAAIEAGKVVRRESWHPEFAIRKSEHPKHDFIYANKICPYRPSLEATQATDWEVAADKG
jgi:hypothetical protein